MRSKQRHNDISKYFQHFAELFKPYFHIAVSHGKGFAAVPVVNSTGCKNFLARKTVLNIFTCSCFWLIPIIVMVMIMDYLVICLIKENYRYIALNSKKSIYEFEQIIVIRSNKIDLLHTDSTLQTKFNNTILLQPICFYFVQDRGKICFFSV